MARKNGRHPLDSDRGTTIVEEPVVKSIVSTVTRRAEKIQPAAGALRLPGDNSPTVGEFFGSLTGTGDFSRGVSVEVTGREAEVELTLTVPHGESIPQLTQSIRDTIVQQVEKTAGIDVKEVNITVVDLTFPEE
ncbi:MAG: Asp23/Gls24 family envelope stress response protein [Rubrobacteraceae bacterium]